jgi:hypothetical protein
MHVQKFKYKLATTYLSLIKSDYNNFDEVYFHNFRTQRETAPRSAENSQDKSIDVEMPDNIRIKIDNIAENLASAVTRKFNVNPNNAGWMPTNANVNPMPMHNYFPNPYIQPYPMLNQNPMLNYRPNLPFNPPNLPQFGYYPHFY